MRLASTASSCEGSNPELHPELACRDLGVAFGVKFIFKNCNLTTFKDEFVAIIGPTGTGKSTLLRTLAYLIPPTLGHVFLDGIEV